MEARTVLPRDASPQVKPAANSTLLAAAKFPDPDGKVPEEPALPRDALRGTRLVALVALVTAENTVTWREIMKLRRLCMGDLV